MESRGLKIALRIWVALVLLFLFIPIALIVLYAFNKSNIESWPIPGVTTHWFSASPDGAPAFRTPPSPCLPRPALARRQFPRPVRAGREALPGMARLVLD